MSDSFKHYSAYYDLLYVDKDYAGEVHYLRSLIDEHTETPPTLLLELGCGTGIHAGLLAQQGFDVLAVDLSEEMLASARERVAQNSLVSLNLSFEQGDARSFRTDRSFDIVASLFHVVSYQTTQADLNAMMHTAASHLNAGGLFIFDFWYGPSVLWQRPAVRAKHLANDRLQVTRLAEPVVRDEFNLVDVNYSVFVRESDGDVLHEIKETHCMRYLFLPEVDSLLNAHGLDRIRTEEWMTGKKPSVDTWGVCVVARKR